MTSRRPAACAALVLTLLSACSTLPSELPAAGPVAAVKAVRLPERSWLPWYTRFADHLWLDVCDGTRWWRIEWNAHMDAVAVREISADTAREDVRWETCVQVLGASSGPAAGAAVERALALAREYPDHAAYRAWPGPNSNSFVDWLVREAGIAVDLPPTAVGKDYAHWLRAGLSSTGTGVELETMLFGAQLGLQEGVELHVLGLTAGVGVWPPSVKLPFLPAVPWGFVGRGRAESPGK